MRSGIERLVRPRSVAVIGASGDPDKTAGRPIAYLRRHGFAGAIYPVNPRYDTLGDLTCYPDVATLPEAPDVGIVLVGIDRVEGAVRDLAARGCASAIVLAGGYRETGAAGAAREDALKAAAGGMRLLGPNTIGLVNATDRIVLSASGALSGGDLSAGRIGVISQSGGIMGSLLSRATGRGIGLSKLIASGNEADLEVADFLDYLAEDEATSVIALYLEAVRDVGRFRAAMAKARRYGKPVVAYKVGRSEAGSRSAMSHTGAMAGADRLYDALFEQAGVIRVDRFSDLLDMPMALAAGRRLTGKRVGILTSTGGAGTIIADRCGLAGFETPLPDPATATRLASALGGDSAFGNPIDLTLAGLQPEIMDAAIGAVVDSLGYDAAVIIVGSSGVAQPDLTARPVIAHGARSSKPLLVYVSPNAPNIVSRLNAQGIPAFDSPEGCVAGLAALHRQAELDARPAPVSMPVPLVIEVGQGVLDEAEAKRLFARFGIPGVKEFTVDNGRDAAAVARQLTGDVVLKVRSNRIAHKSEVGGVLVGVRRDEIERRCDEMRAIVEERSGIVPDGFLVQEYVTGAVELVLGFVRDPLLGPAILLGAGGVMAELFGDTALRLLPLSRQDATDMVASLRIDAVLGGFRGAPEADRAALLDAVLAFAGMAEALGERLAEAEINPLLVLPVGQGVKAADGLVVLR